MKLNNKFLQYISVILLCVSGVSLIAFQQSWGFAIFFAGFAVTALCDKDFRNHIWLIFASLGILSLTKIDTDISYLHMLSMGAKLSFVLLIPWAISKYLYKTDVVEFQFNFARKWTKREKWYVLFCLVLSYLVIPFYLVNSGAYLNWSVDLDMSHISRLFVGTNALGIWDELFFINVVFMIFRRYFSLWTANFAQAILFTSFLFELGFTGWGFLIIFPFALIQGFIYEKTKSLFYVITIHLVLDFILFLALIWSYFPEKINIFLG